jgi:taurine dioxygenase
MAINVRKLGHALGAEVSGVDISRPIDDQTFNEINRAFLEHCVLVFHDQRLTREEQIAFSRRFGELDTNDERSADLRVMDVPEIFLITAEPVPPGQTLGGVIGDVWHTDNSHLPVAAAASLLQAIELPDVGGDTMFCNMYRAYDTLTDGMKKLIEPLQGVHAQGRAVYDLSTPERASESWKRFPAAAHPAVRVHPETGRKALYVNRQVRLFVGLSSAESKPLIDYLTDHAVRPQNVYRHVWKVGDLVMWDNRCVLHMSLGDFDRSQRRHMERTTVHADRSGYEYRGPIQ